MEKETATPQTPPPNGPQLTQADIAALLTLLGQALL